MDTKLTEQEVTDFVGKNAGYYYTSRLFAVHTATVGISSMQQG
jgi:hypothetical protein